VNSQQRLLLLVLSLTVARAAHADAVKDFKAGTTVKLDLATVVAEFPRVAEGTRSVAKSRDSFDFTIAASELGLKYPVSLTLRGRSLGGDRIEYAIDNRYAQPIDLGGGNTLSRVAGTVRMRVAHVRGDRAQTYGNARLALDGTSYVTAYGTWGEYRVLVTQLALRGGVPQPALSRVAAGSARVCAVPNRKTKYPLTITLGGDAKGTGASVDLTSARPSGVGVPPGIVILPGKRSATMTATVKPGFVGTTQITVASGGVEQSIDVTVYPSGTCR